MLADAAFPISAPVVDATGQMQAVLVGLTRIDTPGFLDTLRQGHIGQSGGYLLISPHDHRFIAATKAEMNLKPTPETHINRLHDRAMAGFRGTGLTVNAQGVEELAAIASVPSTDWFVVARLPTEEALAVVGEVREGLIRTAAVMLSAVLVFLYFALTHIFRPLSLAARQADRMTNGDIPLQVLPVRHHDEVGILTAAFNRLLCKLMDSQQEMASLVRKDPLTGLSNRLHLLEKIQETLARSQRNGSKLALLFLDLDEFKPVNDDFGHEIGDLTLREVGRRLSAIVREVDTLARIGGDEFVILMGDLEAHQASAEAAVFAVAKKCIAAIEESILINDTRITIGVSIGIVLGQGNSAIEDLMAAADDAMYAAKKAGRGHYVLASSHTTTRQNAATPDKTMAA